MDSGSDWFDSATDGSDTSESFGRRQLGAAETTEDPSPLPAVEGLSISGDAFPGRVLQACGFFIHGAIRCDFAWVRCFENGSASYIPGATTATYLVNADDVDSFLSVEVIPANDREEKGDLARAFANERRKISCEPQMQEQIERNFFTGQASFDVLLLEFPDSWKKANLEIKRESFSIKINGSLSIVVEEKFSPSSAVTISGKQDDGLTVHCGTGSEYSLRTANESLWRDVIVLTMRLFIMRAVKKQKRRKRCLFF